MNLKLNYDWVEHPLAEKVFNCLLSNRLMINIGIHLLLFLLSYLYSMVLVNGLVLDKLIVEITAQTIGPIVLFRLLVFSYHDLFRGMWRYVSFEDLINIIRATLISSFMFYLLGWVWPRFRVSEQVYLLDTTFCVFFCGGIRVLVRKIRERYASGKQKVRQKRIYLVGPVEKLQLLVKDFVSDPNGPYRLIAMVDPERQARAGVRRVCDVPVLSIAQCVASDTGDSIDAVIICWPGSYRKQVDALVERLKVLNAEFKIIPHYEEILKNQVRISDIRRVEIEDLLERPPVHIDMAGINEYLKGKVVLVTGGAGSIGSEICRQVAGFLPRRLVIVDRSENSLYDFDREIRRSFPRLPISAAISSINDAEGIARIMKTNQVEVVFHAAAYKHVPLMEKTPIESAYNNIIGTYNVAKAAIAVKAKRFVMISTDKAVNPANVMGVTKRIAEMVVQSQHQMNGTRFMTVRFGNVLGSAGSVIPIFKKQIEQGGAVTVTHPDIERFFMTIPEAVQLVLQAGCMAKGGEIFVLDMGRPVRILKLAEKLITLSGKRPYDDIDIVFSGLRPGEKMYEELFNVGEQLLHTPHKRIKVAVCAVVDPDFMEHQINAIQRIIQAKDEKAMKHKFIELVPGYQCQNIGQEQNRTTETKPCISIARTPVAPDAPSAEKVRLRLSPVK